MPPRLKKNIYIKKQAAYKQYLRTKSDIDLHNHQAQRKHHESSTIADLKSNPKQLHKYIKQKHKSWNTLLIHLI